METRNNSQARISDYVRPLASRWWLVLVAVVVATVGVYAYYAHKPDVYTASTEVYYQDPGDPVTGTPSAPQTDRTVEDEATLLYSRGSAAAVARQIGWTGTTEALLKTVSISSKEGEDFILVTAQAGSAREAAAIANAFGATMVNQLVVGVNDRLTQALALTRTQLAAIPAGVNSVAQRAELEDQVNQLVLALKVPPLISRQVNPALAPASPTSPKPSRDALFAFLLSLIGSISLAYGLERFDRRLKNPEEMERAYNRPLLAVLPHVNEPSPLRDGVATLGHAFREPFRALRTNLELESLDAAPRTIVVSSAMPGEGKSTVVRNLALAFRETGKSVVVVDLDLRHPSMAGMFSQPKGAGVTEVLRHDADLDDTIIPIGVELDLMAEFLLAEAQGTVHNGRNGVGRRNGHGPQAEIGLLRAGARPANPAVVLASARLVEVLEALKRKYEIVLIDSAPVLAVSDTIPLMRYADASLFVGRLEVTTRDTAKRLIEFLGRVPNLNLLGIVANDLSRLDAGGYGYGYGYGSYNEQPGDQPDEGRNWLRASRGKVKDPV